MFVFGLIVGRAGSLSTRCMTARISAYSRSSVTAATASAVWMLSLRWVANSHWQCGCYASLTPSLPQPVKFLVWKVHTYRPANSIFDGRITHLLLILSILIEILSPAHAKGEKTLNDFRFGTLTDLFSEWQRRKHGSERVKYKVNSKHSPTV